MKDFLREDGTESQNTEDIESRWSHDCPDPDIVLSNEHPENTREELRGRTPSRHEGSTSNIITDF